MHIAEGVLSAPVILSGAALSIGAVGYGLRKLPQDNLILAGLVGAAFFVASLIHVPVGFSSAHLILNGLVGIVLGWAAYPVIFVALLLQAVLFMFGGLTTLGVNTFTMGTGVLRGADLGVPHGARARLHERGLRRRGRRALHGAPADHGRRGRPDGARRALPEALGQSARAPGLALNTEEPLLPVGGEPRRGQGHGGPFPSGRPPEQGTKRD